MSCKLSTSCRWPRTAVPCCSSASSKSRSSAYRLAVLFAITQIHLACARTAVVHGTVVRHSKAECSTLQNHRVHNQTAAICVLKHHIAAQHSNATNEKAASCVSSINCARRMASFVRRRGCFQGCQAVHAALLYGRVYLCTYLYQRILPVNIPVVALAKYFNILPQLFCLSHAHDSPPLIMDLDTVHVAVCLLLLLSLNQTQSGSHANRGFAVSSRQSSTMSVTVSSNTVWTFGTITDNVCGWRSVRLHGQCSTARQSCAIYVLAKSLTLLLLLAFWHPPELQQLHLQDV